MALAHLGVAGHGVSSGEPPKDPEITQKERIRFEHWLGQE
jgi:hypothetical protein